jgi:hypothetical protein
MMEEQPNSLNLLSLQQVPQVCWNLLREGATSARSALHTPCLATVGEHGPSARTVVLRYCNEEQRTLACHTDLRSAKIHEAKADPRASWLFYDPGRKLQLRLAGQLSIHVDDDFADRRWDDTTAMGRTCYNTACGSGKHVPRPAKAPGIISNEKEARSARSQFAVIACRIEFLDWLLLSAKGHRRAQFHWRVDKLEASWVTP